MASATSLSSRDQLVKNLQCYSDWATPGAMQRFKNQCVVSEYFSLPNHGGGVMMPEVEDGPEIRTLPNGATVSWEDVPLGRVVDHVESFIRAKVDAKKRDETWHKVFFGVEHARRPAVFGWPAPHEQPSTPYSVSRAPMPKTNHQVVEALIKAAGVEEGRVNAIEAIITMNDSVPKGEGSGFVTVENGEFVVPHGRLGRQHTLDDVPNHFVRDECMEYIQTRLPAADQDKVAKAVFDDLNDADLEAYRDAIHAARHAEEVADELKAKLPSLKNRGEAKNLLKLEATIDAIDCDIDLTPNLNGFRAYRDYEVNEDISWSCIHPNQKPTEQEDKTGAGTSIDKNCDQIRAMIARLVKYSDKEWTVDSFRKAIGPLERPKLIDFLQRRGPAAGIKLGLFGLAWEFFRKRELLDVSLPGPPTGTVAQDANALKRKRVPLEERVVNVATKSAEERQVQAKARRIAADPEDGLIQYDMYRKVLAGGAGVDEESTENHQKIIANGAELE
ncbi:hypothetical protein LTR56_002566 [Elasticomyces elasticus]|nr:hypothetical protein LTR22_013468 [Elasticomyces elasticus]KAK3657052.1 hypothetical protein LTR56_002566 [Elasticomyces elasticus]KAK4926719.1 hypothetical protein LTR49_006401 [Elasticomyces elasticus]KAK5762330.1 hypothetical protein LTS12_007489 [Elasticomyces elasticus]